LRKCIGRTSVTRQKKPSATGVKSPRAHNVARRTKAIEHSFAMANRVNNNASAGSDGVDTSNVRAVEVDAVDAETKSKYASYLLHYLLSCLIQINKGPDGRARSRG
jgi:[histone H3]-dimethyl-L-lysine9 demethylase